MRMKTTLQIFNSLLLAISMLILLFFIGCGGCDNKGVQPPPETKDTSEVYQQKPTLPDLPDSEIINTIFVPIPKDSMLKVFTDTLILRLVKHKLYTQDTINNDDGILIQLHFDSKNCHVEDSTLIIVQTTEINNEEFIVLNRKTFQNKIEVNNERLIVPKPFTFIPEILSCLYRAFVIKRRNPDLAIKYYDYTIWLLQDWLQRSKIQDSTVSTVNIPLIENEIIQLLCNAHHNCGHQYLCKTINGSDKYADSAIYHLKKSIEFKGNSYFLHFSYAYLCKLIYDNKINESRYTSLFKRIKFEPQNMSSNENTEFQTYNNYVKELIKYHDSAQNHADTDTKRNEIFEILDHAAACITQYKPRLELNQDQFRNM